MFTLKFYSLDYSSEPAKPLITVICGIRYDVVQYSEGNYSIAVYQKTTSDDVGTEFRVNNHKRDFANCYIENMAGKTIDHYTAIAGEPDGSETTEPPAITD